MRIKCYLLGGGTNGYLVWDEESREAMFIDPGAFSQTIADDIRKEGLSLKYIVLTHGHGDHIGGVPQLSAAFPDAKLAAGADEAPLLADPGQNLSREICGEAVAPKTNLPLKDGDSLALGALAFRVLATPGHTPGGISLYADEIDRELFDDEDDGYTGTLFPGDTLFQGSIGRTDLPGGDFETLKNSVRAKYYTLPDGTIVLPGHMGGTTIGLEKAQNPFVRA